MGRLWSAIFGVWASARDPFGDAPVVAFRKASERKTPPTGITRPIGLSIVGRNRRGTRQRVECELGRDAAQTLVDHLSLAIDETRTGAAVRGRDALREKFFQEYDREPRSLEVADSAQSEPFNGGRVSLLLRAAELADRLKDHDLAERFLDFSDEALTGRRIVVSDLSESWERVCESLPPEGEPVIVLNASERRAAVAIRVPGANATWSFASKRQPPQIVPTHWLPFPKKRVPG